jgi:hypothetical protein
MMASAFQVVLLSRAHSRSFASKTVAYRPLGKGIHLNAPLTLVYRAADYTAATALFVELMTTTTADGDAARGVA